MDIVQQAWHTNGSEHFESFIKNTRDGSSILLIHHYGSEWLGTFEIGNEKEQIFIEPYIKWQGPFNFANVSHFYMMKIIYLCGNSK